MAFNCNKTIVLFCPKKYQPASLHVFLNGVRGQFSHEVKYLGVSPNASLKDNDIQRQIISFHCAANTLGGKFAPYPPAVKYSISCLLHANCGANTHRIKLSI